MPDQHTTLICRRAGPADMRAVLALRERVFVGEQGVPAEIERDADDAHATHLVAARGVTVVGCCRLVAGGAGTRLGRMAVAASDRGAGVGALLLAFAERVAREDGAAEIVLHAQIAARGFYARAGYRAEGTEFLDAGIVHVAMRKRLPDHR